MKRALLLLVCLLVGPAAAQQVVDLAPASPLQLQGGTPEQWPKAVADLAPRLVELNWKAEVHWAAEPNYGNLRLSRCVVRSCQPVGIISLKGEEGGQKWSANVRACQFFVSGQPVAQQETGALKITQEGELVAVIAIEYDGKTYALSLPPQKVALSYRIKL
ncbi:MAG: hypothetical protein AB7S38_42880 [Vulcanimicrobiota bacterium]